MKKQRQIFAIGGRFEVEPWESPLLQQHMLALVPARKPKICLLATASGDNANNIATFYRDMQKHDVHASHMSIFKPPTSDFADFFAAFDIVYVGGGATRNMIALWAEWGVGDALKLAWENGVLLSGTSAGAICWFENCITDSLPQKLLPLDCLGFIKGSCNTHYSSRPDRRAIFQQHVGSGRLSSPGLAIDDNVGVHYIDDKVVDIVTQKEDCYAYWVERKPDGSVSEHAQTPRLLYEE